MHKMAALLKYGGKVTDQEFDSLYPEHIQRLSDVHWTPVSIAVQAAKLLCLKGESLKILDIGSGTGKFCMIGSIVTNAFYTGIERRKQLYKIASDLASNHNLENVSFLLEDITKISLAAYDAFYLFNPFHENLDRSYKIDDTVRLSSLRYKEYVMYVRNELDRLPKTTRVVTYSGLNNEIPSSYEIEHIEKSTGLKLWVKG